MLFDRAAEFAICRCYIVTARAKNVSGCTVRTLDGEACECSFRDSETRGLALPLVEFVAPGRLLRVAAASWASWRRLEPQPDAW